MEAPKHCRIITLHDISLEVLGLLFGMLRMISNDTQIILTISISINSDRLKWDALCTEWHFTLV